MENNPLELAKKIRKILSDKKGEAIALFDVRRVLDIADYCIVVSGSSSPHLRAMFDDVQVELKKEGLPCYRKAGMSESGWMVLDYVDVIVHIFMPDAREYYSIEELWVKAPLVR